MKSLLNKITSTLAGAVLVALGVLMAGVGVSAVMLLALFGVAVAGLALLAAPFVSLVQPADEFAEDTPDASVAA